MNPPTCPMNVFLANNLNDYTYNASEVDLLKQYMKKFFDKKNVKEVLFIDYEDDEVACKPYTEAVIKTIVESPEIKRKLKGLDPNNVAADIQNAQAIIMGGGNMTCITRTFAAYSTRLWSKIISGTPYFGLNFGGEFLSSKYLTDMPPSTGTACEYTYFPVQFMPGFDPGSTAAIPKKVSDMFNDSGQGTLDYIIGLPPDNQTSVQGSGIVLEDARAGLAGGNKTDGEGDPSLGDRIFLYHRTANGIQRIDVKESQRFNLPVNYSPA